MYARIGFGGDLHKKAKDPTTIEGYVNCNEAVQRDVMRICDELQLTHFIHLGDWYDRGYVNDVAAALADTGLDIQMSTQMKGNFYGLIGNHLRLSMDSNPELHLIQPHDEYKSRRIVTRTEQVIKTPKMLRINDVQISFMHNLLDEDDCLKYKPTREEWAKYHIALFHTQCIIPNAKLLEIGHGYNASSNTKIGQALEGVDMAIVGDIHNPLGQFRVPTVTGSCLMIVPGSLTNTDSGLRNRHTTINMPIVTINEDSTVKLQFLPFDLKTNLVTFKQKNVEQSEAKIRALRGKSKERLYSNEDDAIALISNPDETVTSLNAFIQSQGYTERDKSLIRMVMTDPTKVGAMLAEFVKSTDTMF